MMELPELFDFTELLTALRAWAEIHPGGLNDARVQDLAQAAGIARETMWNVFNGSTKLTPASGPGLCRFLGYEGDRAVYFAQLIDLHRAGAGKGRQALIAVWRTYAARHGLDVEEVAGTLSRVTPPEITRAALACALQAMGEEAPSPTVFARAAVAPLTAAAVAEAVRHRTENPGVGGTILAPGLVALPDPRRDEEAAMAWAGALEWIRESTLRTPVDRRIGDFWTCSVDAAALPELADARRRLRRRLERLAASWAETPAEHLFLIGAPQITLTEVLEAPHKLRRMETRDPGLPLAGQTIRMDEPMVKKSTSPSSPVIGCMTLPKALRAWRDTQPRDRRSDTFLGKRMGRKRSYVNDLSLKRIIFKDEHLDEIIHALDLEADDDARAWLTGLARLGEPISAAERVGVLEVLRGIAADHGICMPQVEELLANRWYVAATFALSFLPNFRPVPAWVSRAMRGRITWRAATEALQTLARLKLLPDPNGNHSQTLLGSKETNLGPTVLLYQDEVLRLCEAELDVLSEGAIYTGWMLALPSAALPRLYSAIRRFIADITAIALAADARAAAGTPHDRVMLATAYCTPFLNLPARSPLRA